MSLRFVTGLLFGTLVSLAPSAPLYGAETAPPSVLVPDNVNSEFAKQLDAYLASAGPKDNSPAALETHLTALQNLTPVRVEVLQRLETANADARKTAADLAAAKGGADEELKKKKDDAAKAKVLSLNEMYLKLTGVLQDFRLRLFTALADARANKESKKLALAVANKAADDTAKEAATKADKKGALDAAKKAQEAAEKADKKAQEDVNALEGLYAKCLDLLHADEPGVRSEPPLILIQDQPNPSFASQLEDYLAAAKKQSPEAYSVAVEKLKPLRVKLSLVLENARQGKTKTKLAVDAAAKQGSEDSKTKAKNADDDAQKVVAAFESMYLQVTTILDADKPTDLHLDSYAAIVFSSLYRDPKVDSSYFAKSKSFFNLEISQGIDNAGMSQIIGSIALQTSSFESAQSTTFVTTSGNFAAEGGLNYFPCPRINFWIIHTTPCPNVKPLQLGFLLRLGVVGFATEGTSAEGLAGHANDEFGVRGRVGVILRQQSGDWRGSYSELSFLHDPLFQRQNRVYWRGRLVLTPKTIGGNGLGAFLEGSVNVGKGRDEVQIGVGIKLDTLAVLRGITGGLTSGKPSD